MDAALLELFKLVEKFGVTLALLIYFVYRDNQRLKSDSTRDIAQTTALTQIAERLGVIVNKLDEGS